MKKLFKIFVLLLICICLIGCGKKTKQEENKLQDDEVILEGIKYKLDQDESEYGIEYKIASNFRKTNTRNAINYFSENINDQAYFVYRIFYYKNKSIDYAIKDSTISYDKKYDVKVGDLDYTVVHFVNPIGENVETNIYYYKHNKDVYAFCFTASIDLSRLIDIFLKSIVYE
ncbi:MAG: hypothetical protein IJK67_06140 [Bacilli bacterium]|nr:hypothetical protein [Bacilli bacterium]